MMGLLTVAYQMRLGNWRVIWPRVVQHCGGAQVGPLASDGSH